MPDVEAIDSADFDSKRRVRMKPIAVELIYAPKTSTNQKVNSSSKSVEKELV
jgi:hypothetical protein